MAWLIMYFGGGTAPAHAWEHAYKEQVEIKDGRGIVRHRDTLDYLAKFSYLPVVEFATMKELKMRLDPKHMIDMARGGQGPLGKLDDNRLDQLQTALERDGNSKLIFEIAGVFNAYAAPADGSTMTQVEAILDRHFPGQMIPKADPAVVGASELPPIVPHPDNNENPAAVRDPGKRTDVRLNPDQNANAGAAQPGDSTQGPDAEAIEVQHDLFGRTGNESPTPSYPSVPSGDPGPADAPTWTGDENASANEATEVTQDESGAEIADDAVADHVE